MQCRQWNALPYTGGILEQPEFLMYQMELALSTYDAYIAFAKYGSDKGWFKQNVTILDYITRVNHLVETGEWPDKK